MGRSKMEKPKIPQKPIHNWLREYTSQETRKGYKTAFRSFIEFIYDTNLRLEMIKTPPKQKSAKAKEINKKFEELARTYLAEDRNWDEDLREWILYLRDEKEYSPETQNSYLSAVKMFFRRYRIEVSRFLWDDLSRITERRRNITRDRIPSKDELKRVLNHLNLKGEALVLTLVSSGMRVSEVTQITHDDVFLDELPTRIELRAEYCKNKHGRTVFISAEATEKVKEWLEFKREKWRSKGMDQEEMEKLRQSNRIFPFGKTWATTLYTRALDDVGLGERDPNTNVRKLHLHTLRKFFRTKMSAVLPQQTVEALLGHRNNLAGAYRRIPLEKLREDYLEGETEVTIYATRTTLKRELNGTKTEVEKLRERLDQRNGELEDLKAELKAEREKREELRDNIRKTVKEELRKLLKEEDSDSP